MSTARQRVATALKKYQKHPITQTGTLGNSLGVVAVPGKVNYVYVSIAGSGVEIVYNKRVANIPSLPVDVGRDPIEPDLYQVLNVHHYATGDPSVPLGWGSIPPHGPTHNWVGGDPVYIEKRQLMPLRPMIAGGMNVFVTREVGRYDYEWMQISGQYFNFANAVPETGSRFAMLYVDTDGTLGALTGTVQSLTTMTLDSVPAPYPGTVPIALVRLYAGQSGIVEGFNDTDIADVRRIFDPIDERWRLTGTIFDVNVMGAVNDDVLTYENGHWIAKDIPLSTNMVIFNVRDYGATGDGLTDDTSAIQDAIDDAASEGGGIVYFPKGIYVVNGSLQDGSRGNSQLLLPAVNITGGDPITIHLLGELPPQQNIWYGAGVNFQTEGTIIKGTLNTGSGSLLGGWGPVGSEGDFSYITVKIENILFDMPANPNLTCIDLSHIASIEVQDILINAGEISSIDDFVEPTHSGSYGIRFPKNANDAFNYVRGLTVEGFYWGAEITEHFNGDNISFYGCKYATNHVTATHSVYIGRMLIQWCQQGIHFSGAQHIIIELINFERYTSTNLWMGAKWYEAVRDIDDPDNYAIGHVYWHAVVSGTSTDDTIVIYSALNFHIVHIDDLVNPADLQHFTDPTTQTGDMIYRKAYAVSNLATPGQGASAFASSAAGGHAASLVIDSDDATYWTANVGPVVGGWITIDLGSSKSAGGFRLAQFNNGGGDDATAFDVYGSNDNANYVKFMTVSGIDTSGLPPIVIVESFPAIVTYRYFSFVATAGGANGWAIYTIEIYDGNPVLTTRLPIGTEGQILVVESGLPVWSNVSGVSGTDSHDAYYLQGVPVSGSMPSTNDYLKYNGSVWIPGSAPTGTGGSGDVVGPGSATDGHLVLFDGSSGKLIKDGGAPTGISGGGYTQGAFVHMAGNQSTANDGYPVLVWDAEDYDTDTIHDNSTNNTRLTCKTAGKYAIEGCVRFAANATGYRQAYIQITRGGTVYYPKSTTIMAITTAAIPTDLSIDTQFDLQVNDYVELVVNQNSTGSLNVIGGAMTASPTHFAMQRIG